MKKFLASQAAKTAAIILFVISVLTILFSVVGAAFIYSSQYGTDIYNDSPDEIRDSFYEHAGLNYSVWVMSSLFKGDKTRAEQDRIKTFLNDPNLNYGVIRGQIKDSEIYDKDKYLLKNFEPSKENMTTKVYINEVEWGEDTNAELSERLLSGSYYVNQPNSTEYSEHAIRGIGYDVIESRLYLYDGESFYQVDEGTYDFSDGDYYEDNLDEVYESIWKLSGGLTIDGADYSPLSDRYPDKTLELYDMGKSLSLDYVADLTELNEYLRDEARVNAIDYMEQGSFFATTDTSAYGPMDVYTVVVFPSATIDMTKGFFKGDLFVQAETLAGVMPVLRYLVPVLGILSVIIGLLTFVFLMLSAGHRKGEDGIVLHTVDKIPLDLSAVVLMTVVFTPFVLFMELGFSGVTTAESIAFFIGILSLIVILGALLGIWWCMCFAVNVKAGKWWRNTLCYKVIMLIIGLLKKPWGFIVTNIKKAYAEMRSAAENVKWTTRIWICFFVFGFINLLWVLSTMYSGSVLLLFIPEYILLGIGLFKLVKYFSRLKGAAESMAKGDYSKEVDTKKMPIDLADHGKNLNSIATGMNTAVSERIKSERMKTELITNVSHDIKTPLTSIINYVDLLEKEDLQNEKAEEYVEVLGRQSERLKKLIEDLIEASKASTGNLKLEMTEGDVGVLLTQIIGEYEERFEKAGIEAVSEIPEEPVILKADHRYLWRVFDNLMGNIAKYAQPGTRGYISLKKEEEKTIVSFKNTSREPLNITEEELMQRFVRGDRSRNTDGSGLGLSIAESLTTLMGGKFSIAIDGDLFKATVEF